jgi:predicted nuclease of predicted toxin-antitoxin system
MRLIVDMNLSFRWVDYLVAQGFFAVHWSSVGIPDATDTEILAYAREHDLTVLTNDLDFGAILAVTKGTKPSVIQIRANDVRPEVIGEQTVCALKQTKSELELGALVTVLPVRTRVRILPLLDRERHSPSL